MIHSESLLTLRYVSDLYTFVSPVWSPWGIRQYRDAIIIYAQVELIAMVPRLFELLTP